MLSETIKDFKIQSRLLFSSKLLEIGMSLKFVSLIASLALIVGCSSTGSGASFHEVVQANENAISIRSTFPNTPLGDGGSALAMEHCSKYGKVATLDSNMVTNNIVGTRTYLCQ